MSNKHNEDKQLDQVLQLLIEASNEKKVDLKDYVARLYENIKSVEEEAANKVKDAASTVDNTVRDKPWIYIGAAAVGGFIIGLCCQKRSNS